MPRRHKRLTKKELKEDKVAEFLLEAWQSLEQNSKKIAGILVVIVIAALIVTVAMRQRRAAEMEAQSWLARANLDLKQGNAAGALQSYANIMDRYRGTWSHADASFFAANAHFATGNYDSAMVVFNRYLDLNKRREIFTESAKLGIAQCLEQKGRFREAAESYLKVQREHPESPFGPDALFGAARCYTFSGDLQLAESAYSDLVEEYPGSGQAGMAKLPLLELQAQLRNT